LIGLFSLLVFYLASIFLEWPPLYRAFGFNHTVSFVGLFLFAVFWEAVSQFLGPIGNAISRHHEREADSFAAQLLKQTTDLANALKCLARDNLSNLYPHPLYAWFYYSHPPLLERIRNLEAISLGKRKSGPPPGM
jgi:STE24 endopeptidase